MLRFGIPARRMRPRAFGASPGRRWMWAAILLVPLSAAAARAQGSLVPPCQDAVPSPAPCERNRGASDPPLQVSAFARLRAGEALSVFSALDPRAQSVLLNRVADYLDEQARRQSAAREKTSREKTSTVPP